MTRASRSWAATAVGLVVAVVLSACGAEPPPSAGVVAGPADVSSGSATATATPASTKQQPTTGPAASSTSSSSAGAKSDADARTEATRQDDVGSTGAAGAGVAAGRLLEDLTVRPAAAGGYDRKLFRHWVDDDGDGCDTRAEVLIRESTKPVTRTSTCRVLTGRWTSVYDDRVITDAAELDIDHLVPLAEAWRSGAHRWDSATRRSFANDLGYPPALIAVSASTNRSKGDRPPHEWMPPSAEHGCTYVGEWTATKWRWQLSVTTAEKRHLRQKIESCGGVRVTKPTKARVGTGPGLSGGARQAAPKTTKAPKKSQAPRTSKAPKKSTKSKGTKAPNVSGPVHPGAFCAPAGAKGKTRAGTRMECKSTATDTRNRWRAA